jgi:hypothetical protein
MRSRFIARRYGDRRLAPCVAMVLVLGQLGCAASHDGRRAPVQMTTVAGVGAAPAISSGSRGAGSGGARSAAPVATDAGAAAIPPASGTLVDCRRDRFPRLAAECPARVPTEQPATCNIPDGTACRYLTAFGAQVVEVTCRLEGGQAAWSFVTAPCHRDCSASGVAGPNVARVDASTCESRPLEPCADGITSQAQLDTMLHAVLRDQHDFQLGLEDSLLVDFANGCPTQLRTTLNQPLDQIDALLETLGRVRWACAAELTCGIVVGPSTIAAP